MSQPSIFPNLYTLRVVALFAAAALLLPGFSFRDAHAADPPGDASVSGPNKKAPMSERELVDMRGMLLARLIFLDPWFREAQAAWKAAEARSQAEIAKDSRSAVAHQAHKDASAKWHVQEGLARGRSDAYAKLVFNWLSLKALYAPPTLRKPLEKLAKQTEIAWKTSFGAGSNAERDVLFATHLRDAQTIHTLGQLLVTAEHCRPDAAARISREVDQLESEFKATLQAGRERLKKLVTEEPFTIELDPQKLKGEAKLVDVHLALLEELALTNAELRQTQSDLEATTDALQKATLPAERQDIAQRQAALQEDLQLREATRSKWLDQLAANLQRMGGSHTPADVSKRIEDRLAKTLKGRDAGTGSSVVQLLAAAEHLRRIGKSEAADRISKEADLLEKELAAMPQTAQERSTETPGESAPPQPERAPAPKVVELRLLDDEQVLVNRRGKITLDEFKKRLGDAMANYEQQGIQPSAVRVHLSAAENVSCGRFEQLIKDCWENRIEHYVLTIEAIYFESAPRDKRLAAAPPVKVAFSLPREANAVAEEAVPPFSIRLSANEDGSLAGIRVGEIQFRRLVQLHAWAMELKHKADGPHAPLTAEFDTDEKLAFKCLAEAVLAVSVHVGPFHRLWPLIENVVPIRLPIALEEIEDFEGAIDPSDNSKTSPPPSIQVDPPPEADVPKAEGD